MRIIAGKYKGKILTMPKTDEVRPTADKVKQALFTKLQFDIVDANVLDLFGGSGALSVEAISRGAKNVTIVDNNPNSIRLIKTNLASINEKANLIKNDYKTYLKTCKDKYDIILLDPPYHNGLYENALSLIYENELLSPNGIIVCEMPKELEVNSNFKIVDTKIYGTIKLLYLTK